MRAFTIIAVFALVGCSTDRTFDPTHQAGELRSERQSKENRLKGTVSASASVFTQGMERRFVSARIPFESVFDGNTYPLPVATRVRSFESMIQVDAASSQLLENGHEVQFASFTDPETLLDLWVDSNYQGPPTYEDTWLATPPWMQLTGATYSEDISGNGSAIATITIEPISSLNPEGRIRMTLNGNEIIVGNPRHESNNGGWLRTSSNLQAKSYSTGAVIMTGTSRLQMQEPTLFYKQRVPDEVSGSVLAAGSILLNSLLPPVAQAQGNCNTFLRGALIGVAAMYYNGRRANVQGFFISWISVVNNMHAFARCKERY